MCFHCISMFLQERNIILTKNMLSVNVLETSLWADICGYTCKEYGALFLSSGDDPQASQDAKANPIVTCLGDLIELL